MLEREINPHEGCPYRNSCEKDESKCCYLIKKGCLLNDEDCEDYL